MKLFHKVRILRDQYQADEITLEHVVTVLSDIAYKSGNSDEDEEFILSLAYEYVTDKEFIPEEWF